MFTFLNHYKDYKHKHRSNAYRLTLNLFFDEHYFPHAKVSKRQSHHDWSVYNTHIRIRLGAYQPRYIVLNSRALTVIRHARALQNQLYSHKPRWLFANPQTHKPFRCIHHRWSRIRQQLGLDGMRIHDLRHSYASTLVSNGATLYKVQKLLGHARSATTERYAHLANHRLQQAASLIDKAYE